MLFSQQHFVILSFLAIVPALLILFYVYKRDRFPEPPRVVFITLVLGFGIVLPIQLFIPIFEGLLENLFFGVESKIFFMAFIRAAFLEESMKFLVLILYCLHLDEFDEPMDALVYGVAASLGFAIYENWEYIMIAYSADGVALAQQTVYARTFSAIPLHALCGVFMGFFLMDAVFDKENRKLNFFLSLFFPICVHGLYDYILMSSTMSRPLMWIYILIGLLTLRAYFIFKRQRNIQTTGHFFNGTPVASEKYIPQTNEIVRAIFFSLFILFLANYLLNFYMY